MHPAHEQKTLTQPGITAWLGTHVQPEEDSAHGDVQ